MSSKISACIALGFVVCTFQILAVVPGASASGAFVVELPDDFYAFGISGDGKVLVGGGPGGIAARWTAEAGVELLGFNGSGSDASTNGSIVSGSWFHAGGEEAVRWTEPGGAVGLGDLSPPDPPINSFGHAISADGTTVVGSDGSRAGNNEAFRWTAPDGMVGLGHLPGTLSLSGAAAVSADGAVVVGSSTVSGSPGLYVTHAFRWTEADGMVYLGGLGGADRSSAAYDVSADGSVVVGESDDRDGRSHAFRWTEAEGMVSLGFGRAWAVSADGSIVAGGGAGGAFLGGFLWDAAHGMRQPMVSGWSFIAFESLSADGRVALALAEDANASAHQVLVTFPDPGAPECSDAFDNDGDLLGDFPDDPGCTALDDPTEAGECQNGIDDDGDERVDLDDPGCDGAIDPSEHSSALVCDDALDNDGDGSIDLDDPGCFVPEATPENPPCDDGIDNDGDGLTDFADPTCSPDWPYWESSPCGLGAELVIALPIVARLRKRLRAREQAERTADRLP